MIISLIIKDDKMNKLKKDCEAWTLWAHIRYIAGDLKGAKERYERVLLFTELPLDQSHPVYIRLASIYLKEEKVFLINSKSISYLLFITHI